MKILINRLQSDKKLLHKYDRVIKQPAKAEIIEEVLDAVLRSIIYPIILFLPLIKKLQKSDCL